MHELLDVLNCSSNFLIFSYFFHLIIVFLLNCLRYALSFLSNSSDLCLYAITVSIFKCSSLLTVSLSSILFGFMDAVVFIYGEDLLIVVSVCLEVFFPLHSLFLPSCVLSITFSFFHLYLLKCVMIKSRV